MEEEIIVKFTKIRDPNHSFVVVQLINLQFMNEKSLNFSSKITICF